tara:strand:+ start:408 stop:509 length:102 start_codon:yes stop_codon:yes gene_type:complete
MGEFDQMLCTVWMVQSKAGGIGGRLPATIGFEV